MKVETIALAVLIQLCVSSVSGAKLRRRLGHRRRERLGRQQEQEISPSPAPTERYDLTSYAGDYDYQAPPLSYGAPPEDQDVTDVYLGDIPPLDTDTVPLDQEEEEENDKGLSDENYDNIETGAASDSGVEEEDEGTGVGDGEAVPAWCDPTHPMGAWLNYFNIQVRRRRER